MNECPIHYADQACFLTAPLVEHEQIAHDTWRARIECPDLAERMVPGQFVMVRLDGWNDPLIGRALAMYDRSTDAMGAPTGIDVVYLVKGKFTQALSRCSVGTSLGVWGPLGNGFAPREVEHLILVAGGVGQTPMLTLGREALGKASYGTPARPSGYAKKVTLCYGARSANRLAGVRDFEAAGFELRFATDDGTVWGSSSKTKPMKVTEQLMEVLSECPKQASLRIACCGPEPMMEAVSEIARHRGIDCEISLETPMACGIGICFTCVAKIRQEDGSWDYKRTCIEGPVFDAANVVW